MTNREIGFKIGHIVREERKLTNELLDLVVLAVGRRAYEEHGFPSMFKWLVDGFGFTNAAAYRRIECALFLKSVPEAREKLASGKLHLSTLSKVQSIISAHEKGSGEKLSVELKREIVNEIESVSVERAEKILLTRFPDAASIIRDDKRTVIDANTTRVSVNLNNQAMQDLQTAKEILSHKFPEGSDADILAYALNFMVSEKMRKKVAAANERPVTIESELHEPRITSAAEAGCVIEKCEFQDPISGQVCGSRFQLQRDHILPKAMGGGDEPTNIRILCRSHNLHMAERALGKPLMSRYRRHLG